MLTCLKGSCIPKTIEKICKFSSAHVPKADDLVYPDKFNINNNRNSKTIKLTQQFSRVRNDQLSLNSLEVYVRKNFAAVDLDGQTSFFGKTFAGFTVLRSQ